MSDSHEDIADTYEDQDGNLCIEEREEVYDAPLVVVEEKRDRTRRVLLSPSHRRRQRKRPLSAGTSWRTTEGGHANPMFNSDDLEDLSSQSSDEELTRRTVSTNISGANSPSPDITIFNRRRSSSGKRKSNRLSEHHGSKNSHLSHESRNSHLSEHHDSNRNENQQFDSGQHFIRDSPGINTSPPRDDKNTALDRRKIVSFIEQPTRGLEDLTEDLTGDLTEELKPTYERVYEDLTEELKPTVVRISSGEGFIQRTKKYFSLNPKSASVRVTNTWNISKLSDKPKKQSKNFKKSMRSRRHSIHNEFLSVKKAENLADVHKDKVREQECLSDVDSRMSSKLLFDVHQEDEVEIYNSSEPAQHPR